jgi:hypothetical protein
MPRRRPRECRRIPWEPLCRLDALADRAVALGLRWKRSAVCAGFQPRSARALPIRIRSPFRAVGLDERRVRADRAVALSHDSFHPGLWRPLIVAPTISRRRLIARSQPAEIASRKTRASSRRSVLSAYRTSLPRSRASRALRLRALGGASRWPGSSPSHQRKERLPSLRPIRA